MTVEELYTEIGGSYAQAKRVLRVDRLIDKHIKKFGTGNVVDNLIAAGETMDPTALFESAHAAKGVCGNLGLTDLMADASTIAEEFRPGNPRTMTDDDIKAIIARVSERYATTKAGIARYAAQ